MPDGAELFVFYLSYLDTMPDSEIHSLGDFFLHQNYSRFHFEFTFKLKIASSIVDGGIRLLRWACSTFIAGLMKSFRKLVVMLLCRLPHVDLILLILTRENKFWRATPQCVAGFGPRSWSTIELVFISFIVILFCKFQKSEKTRVWRKFFPHSVIPWRKSVSSVNFYNRKKVFEKKIPAHFLFSVIQRDIFVNKIDFDFWLAKNVKFRGKSIYIASSKISRSYDITGATRGKSKNRVSFEYGQEIEVNNLFILDQNTFDHFMQTEFAFLLMSVKLGDDPNTLRS